MPTTDDLLYRLRYLAQNEYMIDQHFTGTGCILNEAHDRIERLEMLVTEYHDLLSVQRVEIERLTERGE